MARESKENRFEGRVVKEGLGGGAIGLIYNPRLEARIPPEVKARVSETEDKIRTGRLEVDP